MASIADRPSGNPLMKWRAPDPVTGRMTDRSRIFKGSKADALREANRLEAEERREPVQSTRGKRLGAFLAEWQAWRAAAGNCARKTVHRDNQHVKVITTVIGDRPLAKLGPQDIDQMIAALRRRYSPVTVSGAFGVLRKALRQARKWRLITGAPWEDATPPPRSLASPSPPSVADTLRLAELLEAAGEPVAAALVRIMLASGARKSELLALVWGDIDLDRGTLRVHRAVEEAGGHFGIKPCPKNASSRRTVALPTDCVARLKVHRSWVRERQLESGRSWNAEDWVFPDFRGALWRPSRATAIVSAVARANGLQTGLHCIRHAHAVLLLEQQVPIKVVADRLGHADPAMTLRVYQHVTEQASQLAVAALDRTLKYTSSASPDAENDSSDGAGVVDFPVDSGGGRGRKNP